jgi:hypothetical protein
MLSLPVDSHPNSHMTMRIVLAIGNTADPIGDSTNPTGYTFIGSYPGQLGHLHRSRQLSFQDPE